MEAGGVSQYDQFRLDEATLTPQQIAATANDKVAPWSWPGNNGAVAGTANSATLEPGQVLDRIGNPSGTFLSPVGTDITGRALAPGSFADMYSQYVVLKPFIVEQSGIAPAFGEMGGGVQFKIPGDATGERVTVQDLINNGYLGVKK
jgi:hypothetical protein